MDEPPLPERTWQDVASDSNREYDRLDKYVLAKQQIAGKVLHEWAQVVARARMVEGKEGGLLGNGQYVCRFSLERLAYAQMPEEKNAAANAGGGGAPRPGYEILGARMGHGREKQFAYATDYLRYWVQQRGEQTLVLYSIKNCESAAAKVLKKVAWADEQITFQQPEPHADLNFAASLVLDGIGLGKSRRQPKEIAAWLSRMHGTLSELQDIELEIDRRVRFTITDMEKRAEILGILTEKAVKIEQHFIAEHYNGKMNKIMLGNGKHAQMEAQKEAPWPFDTHEKARWFFNKCSPKEQQRLGRWADRYLSLFLEYKFQPDTAFPRQGIALVAYQLLSENIERERLAGKAPELGKFLGLGKATLEFEKLATQLPGQLGKSAREKFLFINKAMRALAEVLKAAVLAVGELERLPERIRDSPQKLVQLALLEYARTDCAEEDGLLAEITALAESNKRIAKRSGLSNYPFMHGKRQYLRIIEWAADEMATLDEGEAAFKKNKAQRAGLELELYLALEKLWALSPVEAKIIADEIQSLGAHNRYKQGHRFPLDLNSILTPERKSMALQLLNHAAIRDSMEGWAALNEHWHTNNAADIKFGLQYSNNDDILSERLDRANAEYFMLLRTAPCGLSAVPTAPEAMAGRYRLEEHYFDSARKPEEIFASNRTQKKVEMPCTQTVGCAGAGAIEFQASAELPKVRVEYDMPATAMELEHLSHHINPRKYDEHVFGHQMGEKDFDRLVGFSNGCRYAARMRYLRQELPNMYAYTEAIAHDPDFNNTALSVQSEYLGSIRLGGADGKLTVNPPAVVKPMDGVDIAAMRGGLDKTAVRLMRREAMRLPQLEALIQYLHDLHENKYKMLGKCMAPIVNDGKQHRLVVKKIEGFPLRK